MIKECLFLNWAFHGKLLNAKNVDVCVAYLILTLFAQLLGGTDEGTDGKESPSLLSYHHKQNASKIDTLRLSSSYLGYIRITYLHCNANSNGTNNIIL